MLVNENCRIMGIVNVNPDSFYCNSKVDLSEKLKLVSDADIIDVGAESSKPGSIPISYNDEISRLSKILPLLKTTNKTLSIDTYKYQVAKYALENGFNIVNDITGGKSKKLLQIVSEYQSKIILMHMQGTPNDMQNNPKYDSLIDDIMLFFDKRINKAIKSGIKEDKIIIDPGVGFGKTVNDNDKIICSITTFKSLGFPVMIGLSRKSFLQNNDDLPIERLSNTVCANTLCIIGGADIIRVHDVNEHLKVRSFLIRMNSNFRN